MTDQLITLEVRSAAASDAAAVSDLLEQLGFPSSAAEVTERLRTLNKGALVAVRAGRVVGLITMNIMPVLHRPTSVGRISTLIVSKKERGSGIGRALVVAAEQLLHQQGCDLVEVTSNMKLADAHAFYERLGYEATSLRFAKALRR